ncbi:hypothetical protein ABK040_007763 [Willaertia magna]
MKQRPFIGLALISLLIYISFYFKIFKNNKDNIIKNGNLQNNNQYDNIQSSYLNNNNTNDYFNDQFKFRNFVKNELLLSGEDFLNNINYLNKLYSVHNKNLQYSKIRVHNSFININSIDRETFLLENVCVNHKGELLFFTTKDLYDNWLNTYERTIGSVQTWSKCDRGGISLRFVFDKIKPDVKWYDTPTLMMVRFAAGNVGHHIADTMVAMQETIEKFNLNPNNVSILYLDEIKYRDDERTDGKCSFGKCELPFLTNPKTKDCNWCVEEVSSYGYNKNNTIRFSLQMTQLFSKQPILQRCSYTTTTHESGERLLFRIERAPCPMDEIIPKRETKLNINFNEVSNEINICFKKLIFGVADRAMISGLDFAKFRELGVMGLRKQILKNLNLYEKVVNDDIRERVRIGIHVKPLTGRHGNVIYNAQEIISYLSKLNWNESFPVVKKFEFIPIILEEMNLIEQIELFSTINIYISTIGSGSIYSLFMPNDSYLIYAPECRFTSKEQMAYQCGQPIIYFHTNLVHISIFDATPTVSKCMPLQIPSDDGFCNPVLDQAKVEEQVKQALTMRLLNV